MKIVSRRINEIGQIITGNTPPTKQREYYGGPHKLIMPTDIVEGERFVPSTIESLSEKGFLKYQKALLPPYTTCVVTIGTLGRKICLTLEEAFTNQAINAVIPFKDKYDPLFVFYLLKYNLPQVANLSSGTASGRENVSKSSFGKITVNLVESLADQKRIASILSAYDELIENNRRRIALLEEMAEELYKEWFVRLRFPGHADAPWLDAAGNPCPAHSEGALPEGWAVQKVGDAFDIVGGGTPSTSIDSFWDGEIDWYSPTDLTRGKGVFVFDSGRKITNAGLQGSSAKLLPPYTVLFTSRATIGEVAITVKESCTNQGFISCIPNESLPYTYLFQWLRINKKLFENFSSGATFMELSKGVFRTLNILTPEVSVIADYHDKAKLLLDEIKLLIQKNQVLQETRDLLLPRLMSGKLALPEGKEYPLYPQGSSPVALQAAEPEHPYTRE